MADENRRSSEKSDAPHPDLRSERDQFVRKFTRGSRLTEDFVKEYGQLERKLEDLETENALLRNQVEAGNAIRELLYKIEHLETEKAELLSRFHRAQDQSSKVNERVQEMEFEFANLANLFVASDQIHSSLSPRGVMRRIKEVLAQLLGAERYAIYFTNAEGSELVPIASEGVSGSDLVPVRVAGTAIGEVFRVGSAFVDDDEDAGPARGSLERPAAVLPLLLEDRTVGVVAIFSTLPQKERFDTVDFELFKLLGQQAAAALIAASLFAQADRKLPGLEAFLDLSV